MARTQEEIIRACEQRMAELEEQAARRRAIDAEIAARGATSCGQCRWGIGYDNGKLSEWERKHPRRQYCANPLIKGFERNTRCVDHLAGVHDEGKSWGRPDMPQHEQASLCGLDKAFWEPRRTWRTRLRQFFSVLFRGPVWDGNVISKCDRSDLIDYGLAVRCCFMGEQGYTAATYLGGSVFNHSKAVPFTRKPGSQG